MSPPITDLEHNLCSTRTWHGFPPHGTAASVAAQLEKGSTKGEIVVAVGAR